MPSRWDDNQEKSPKGAPLEEETGLTRETYKQLSRKDRQTLQELYRNAGAALPVYIAQAIDHDIEDEYDQFTNMQKRYEENFEIMAHGYTIDKSKRR